MVALTQMCYTRNFDTNIYSSEIVIPSRQKNGLMWITRLWMSLKRLLWFVASFSSAAPSSYQHKDGQARLYADENIQPHAIAASSNKKSSLAHLLTPERYGTVCAGQGGSWAGIYVTTASMKMQITRGLIVKSSCPANVMTEELLQNLVLYRKSHEKAFLLLLDQF
ncbi:hypothetical protein OROMI_011227 [Orobanche minor]